jgi:hypothetical protein
MDFEMGHTSWSTEKDSRKGRSIHSAWFPLPWNQCGPRSLPAAIALVHPCRYWVPWKKGWKKWRKKWWPQWVMYHAYPATTKKKTTTTKTTTKRNVCSCHDCCRDGCRDCCCCLPRDHGHLEINQIEKRLVLIILVIVFKNKNKKIQVRIHSTVKVIRA